MQVQIESLTPWQERLFGEGLLPNEPRVLHWAAQQQLTEQYLLPVLAALEQFFLAVRAELDPPLQRAQPRKLGKPYPLGQCLEISLAAEHYLRNPQLSGLSAGVALGQAAFMAFLQAGGAFRQVWGDLRGEYFQNAFQLGTLYVDVSNDTVTLTKPKVEILPFDQARFVPVRDYQHFERVALSYWQGQLYPNHLLPELAPYFPLIHVGAAGHAMFRDSSDYMLAMTLREAFRPSEAVLAQPPMPLATFEHLQDGLQARLQLPSDPEQGRLQALRCCQQYREARWHHSEQQSCRLIALLRDINQHLAAWHSQIVSQPKQPVQPASAVLHSGSNQEPSHMTTLNFDGQEYSLESLSDEAKAQLAGIQFVDQELARLQAQVAALQTARNAYLQALKAALPSR